MLLLFLWALLANLIAIHYKFYRLAPPLKKDPKVVTLKAVLASFGIYLAIAMIAAPLLIRFVIRSLVRANLTLPSPPLLVMTAIGLASLAAIFALLQIYILQGNPTSYRSIWKQKTLQKKSILSDLSLGAITWVMSFPIVSMVAALSDLLLKHTVGLDSYEQNAVQYVKEAASAPLPMIFSILSVVIGAPLVEEFLFRGVLQTHLRGHFGSKAAILLTALLFSLFHFAPSQGLGNLSLILSLFVFGSFLGFLYEKRASLWAPIGLHITVNLVSAIRVLAFGEG